MGNSNDSSLLSSLEEKSQAFKIRGGIEKIERTVSELSASHEKNEEILKECERLLTDEERSDKKLRAKFGDKWTLTPSAELNKNFNVDISLSKLLMDHNAAGKEKYEKDKDKFAMFCLSEDGMAEFLIEKLSKGSSRSSMQREINSAYDAYIELLNDLKEGSSAFENLSREITTLQDQVNDFCTARYAERDDLVKRLPTNVATIGTQTSCLQSPNEEVSQTGLLSKQFKDLFMNEKFWDIVLKVGDKEFKAHKAILSVRSSVLSDKLDHDSSEKQPDIIEIPDCDPDTFKVFLEYLYTGELENVSSDIMLQLYNISDRYSVQELKKHCVKYLIKNITM